MFSLLTLLEKHYFEHWEVKFFFSGIALSFLLEGTVKRLVVFLDRFFTWTKSNKASCGRGIFEPQFLATPPSPSNHRPVNNQALIICYTYNKSSSDMFASGVEYISVLHFLHHWEYNVVISAWRCVLVKRLSKSYKKWEMFEITWNAARLRNPGLLGNRLPQNTNSPRFPRQANKSERRENVFPSDRLWRVPVVGFHYVGTLCDHWRGLWNNIRATAGVFAG